MNEPIITVPFTVAEWNAIHSCAQGELESLTEADVSGGGHADLDAAVKRMQDARRRAAKRKRSRQ